MEAKPNTPCMSVLAVARLASRQRAPLAEEAQHLSTCPMCRAQLEAESAQAYAAAQEPVPAAILALARDKRLDKHTPAHARPGSTSRLSHFQHGIMALLAIVGVGLMAQRMVGVPASMDAPVEHAKGSVQVSGAVKDARNAVHPLDDLSNLGTLQAGDTLQVHVQAFDKANVSLADADDHTVYYDGEIPAGGWLPVGIEVTPEGPLHLTLQVCTKTPGTPCQTWELH